MSDPVGAGIAGLLDGGVLSIQPPDNPPPIINIPSPLIGEPQFQGQNPDGVYDYLYVNNISMLSTGGITLGNWSWTGGNITINSLTTNYSLFKNLMQFSPDNTYDIGNYQPTPLRPRDIHAGRDFIAGTEAGGGNYKFQHSAGGTNYGLLASYNVSNGDLTIGGANVGSVFFGQSGSNRWFIENGTGNFKAVTDATYDIGGSAANRPRNGYFYGLLSSISLAVQASVQFQNGVQPGYNNGVWGAIFDGTGVPSNAIGNNGDYYFRNDTPGTANQRIYVKSAGAWVGIV